MSGSGSGSRGYRFLSRLQASSRAFEPVFGKIRPLSCPEMSCPRNPDSEMVFWGKITCCDSDKVHGTADTAHARATKQGDIF